MKRILTAALALSLLSGTAASAQDWNRNDRGNDNRGHQSRGHDNRGPDNRGHEDRGRGREARGDDRRGWNGDNRGYGDRYGYNTDRGYDNHRRWARGQRLPTYYRSSYIDYRRHHLRRPPYGYQWVQVNNDYVLAAVATGLIMEVINGHY